MVDLHGISQETFDDGIGYEVSSRDHYEHALRGLTWPALNSGPTCGIGYDLGQASRTQIQADWEGKVSDAELTVMLSCAGVTGTRARDLTLELRGAIDIAWDVALEVYTNHDLPRTTAMCRAHLPGYEDLSAHCKGALFSLVLNRGASFDLQGPRYAEMRDIKAAIKRGDLARVPALLRSMKRIWKDDPAAKGLLARREKEARRWEQGLAEHHPEEHARLDQVAPVPDPELVARVLQQLKSLGYWQVGSADGSLTPQGRTEDAILAFRNHEGLPLSASIDDEFLTRLAKAQPPEIAEHRANATVEDLRAQGSQTIAFTDRAKAWAGRMFGGGGVVGGSGLVALVTDKATALKGAQDAVGSLGIPPQAWWIAAAGVAALVVLAGAGLGIWYVADRLEARRLADYQTGKNP
jgi:hypothetical protein